MTAGIVSCVPLESMAAGILVAVPQLASSGSAASIVKPIPLFASRDRKCRDISTQRVSQMLHETLSTACEELRRHFLAMRDDLVGQSVEVADCNSMQAPAWLSSLSASSKAAG